MKLTIGAFATAALVGLSACVPATTTTTTTVIRPGTANLNVVNNSGRTAYYVQISPCSSSTWGPDRLGSDQVLSSGTTRSITLPAGCYDLRASDDVTQPNGSTWVQRNAQLSSGGSFDWTLFR